MRANATPQRYAPRVSFRQIDFGEDDANLDYEIALRRNDEPVFIRAFYEHPQIDLAAFGKGIKYLITGQKGTGKTAILRKLSSDLARSGTSTEFMIFRDEIASKEELDKFGPVFAVKVNEVKKLQHHLYVIERILLLLVASKLEAIAAEAGPDDPADPGFSLSGIYTRIFRQPVERQGCSVLIR
jgi:hypothetical protein